MKKRIIALAAALALCISMAGCTISTPATVGKIGDVEITSGMYLLSQFQAFSAAQGLASSEQDTSNVKKFLKQSIVTDADSAAASSQADSSASGAASAASGAASAAESDAAASSTAAGTKVSEYVAAETLKNLQYYAAVKTRFAALGGELTADEIAQADSTAQSIWDANSDLYAKNGFGLASIQEYEYALTMANDLLELTYGAQGEQPVSDDTLTDYLENDLVYGYYISVPLYNSATYAFADTDQSAQIKDACQAVVDEYTSLHTGAAAAQSTSDSAAADSTANTADGSSASSDAADTTADSAAATDSTAAESTIHDDFYQAVLAKLPDAYAVLDNTYDASTISITANFIDDASMSYYGDDADKIRNCKVGEGVVVALGTYSYEIFVREDPLAVNSLEDVRETALQNLKGQELQDALYAYGADTLENALDESAVKQLPATKIKLASSTAA